MQPTDTSVPDPNRSDEDLIEIIHDRVARLRTRRRVRLRAGAAGLAALLIVLVTAITVSASGRDSTTKVRTADEPTTESATTGSTSTSTTTQATAPIATVPTTPDTGPSTGPTTILPTTTLPITTITQPPLCSNAQLLYSISTDKTRYALGEPVRITRTVRNQGPTCWDDGTFNLRLGCFLVKITDTAGHLIFQNACPASAEVGPVDGGTVTSAATTWPQVACADTTDSCAAPVAPAGTYTITTTTPAGSDLSTTVTTG